MTAHQSPRSMIANAADRVLSRMFPGFFSGSTKHDHYRDFGWPEQLDFTNLYRMYTRNGIAAAGVDRTISKTWQDDPALWETPEPAMTKAETAIAERFTAMRVWQHFAEADRRSMVGQYAGVIIRLRDSKQLHEPVDTVQGGLDGIAGLIPFWESQLTASTFDADPESEEYGNPVMFTFNEAAIQGQQNNRSFNVHPDRVLIFSDDGTINCRSALEPGYNDLIDAEKVKGAGGEGFWKSSRGAPIITAAAGLTLQEVASNMGVTTDKALDTINSQIDDFQRGLDKGLMLGGMSATPMTISLPDPENFFGIAIQSFAASILMPVKILLGSQTGERASTEDANEWNQTCHARRVQRIKPIISEFAARLVRWGIIPDKPWHVGWADLTEAGASDKIARAKIMADINAATVAGDEPAFDPDEIRETAGYAARGDEDDG